MGSRDCIKKLIDEALIRWTSPKVSEKPKAVVSSLPKIFIPKFDDNSFLSPAPSRDNDSNRDIIGTSPSSKSIQMGHVEPSQFFGPGVQISADAVMCACCNKWFKNRSSHDSHVYKRNINAIESETGSAISHKPNGAFICPICFVPQNIRRAYETHLDAEHGTKLDVAHLEFDSWQDFEQWRAKIERQTSTHYVKRHQPNRSKSFFFVCNRTGTAPSQAEKRRRIRAKKKSGFDGKRTRFRRSLADIGLHIRRIGAYCPARIRVDFRDADDRTGRLSATFCSTHLGHKLDENEIGEKRKRVWKMVLNHKAEEIPERLRHDNVMMEHDYFSWIDLHHCDSHHPVAGDREAETSERAKKFNEETNNNNENNNNNNNNKNNNNNTHQPRESSLITIVKDDYDENSMSEQLLGFESAQPQKRLLTSKSLRCVASRDQAPSSAENQLVAQLDQQISQLGKLVDALRANRADIVTDATEHQRRQIFAANRSLIDRIDDAIDQYNLRLLRIEPKVEEEEEEEADNR